MRRLRGDFPGRNSWFLWVLCVNDRIWKIQRDQMLSRKDEKPSCFRELNHRTVFFCNLFIVKLWTLSDPGFRLWAKKRRVRYPGCNDANHANRGQPVVHFTQSLKAPMKIKESRNLNHQSMQPIYIWCFHNFLNFVRKKIEKATVLHPSPFSQTPVIVQDRTCRSPNASSSSSLDLKQL